MVEDLLRSRRISEDSAKLIKPCPFSRTGLRLVYVAFLLKNIFSVAAATADTTGLCVPFRYLVWRSNLVHFFNDLKIK
jgi:hypothetical protein